MNIQSDDVPGAMATVAGFVEDIAQISAVLFISNVVAMAGRSIVLEDNEQLYRLTVECVPQG